MQEIILVQLFSNLLLPYTGFLFWEILGFILILALALYVLVKDYHIYNEIHSWAILIMIVIGAFVKYIISLVVFRLRPMQVLELNYSYAGLDSSFFSMHTYTAFLLLFVIFLIERDFTIRLLALFIAILVGLSRIFMLEHYFTDVFAGIVFAYFGYLGVLYLVKYIKKKN